MSVLVGLVILTLAGVLWLRRRVLVVAVKGRSMQPALLDGDRVLVWRRPVRRVKRGDMVVLQPPTVRLPAGPGRWVSADDGLQVKRVAAIAGEAMPDGVRSATSQVPAGTLVVLSDNLEVGLDSRHWGPYAASGLVGVVMRRMGETQ
ncbi:S26 family signal peptidase [Nonomuraea sp. TT08I-71]|nr:S26 family signal peptidase [Nonomuraea sp. TT08I-71]